MNTRRKTLRGRDPSAPAPAALAGGKARLPDTRRRRPAPPKPTTPRPPPRRPKRPGAHLPAGVVPLPRPDFRSVKIMPALMNRRRQIIMPDENAIVRETLLAIRL